MLSKVDELVRSDHFYLDGQDDCYFLREYTSHQPFQFSETNQLIYNLKKSPDRKGRPEYRHKESAIRQVAGELRDALNPDWLRFATLVPTPPSKARGDPLYDDRISRMLTAMGDNLDARELVIQPASTTPDHGATARRLPAEISGLYQIDDRLVSPTPRLLGIFDDVLVTGAHYKAMKSLLRARFPDAPIVGLFVARRVFANLSDDGGPAAESAR